MKKTLLLIALVLCCATTIFAQNNKISYQAVVRDTENKLVANQTVTVTVNIFNGEETTAVYSETHENVQTNVNGLISLLIGPDQTDDAWNSIQWANARVETKVTLDGVLLGTLVMPLTAVPYALYADEINPAGTVVTNIYNKMQRDSIALAEKMRADSTVIRNALSDSTSAVRSALVDSTSAVRTALVDSTSAVRSALVDSTSAVRTALVDSVTNINTRVETTAETLHNEINTLETDVTNRMNTISDSVKTTLDSVTTVSTNLHSEITAVSTDMQTNYAKLAGDNEFFGNNTFSGNNTYSGNNTFTGTVTAGTVNASSVTVTCGNSNLDICTMYNELTQLIAGMQNTIDSLKDVITELLPSLSLKGTTDTVFTNGNTVNVTYTANFSNANSTDYTFHWTVDGTAVNSTSNPYTHPYTTTGTHKVVCTATRTGYATLTDSITTTISKGTPVVTAPTAKNLTYNTNAQTLVTAGTTTGGTLYYKVTTTNSKPAADASGWSTTLPQGTNAGTYYVWYKVVGGDNYINVDVSNTSVAVNIAKAAGSISYSTTSVTKNAGDAAFTNPLTKAGDGTVTYSISNNNGSSCSINTSTGEVTVGSTAGTATITATVTDGTNYSYATKTATYTLTVQAADPIVVNSTFQYCYDCQRSPAYPVSGSTCTLSSFKNPSVGNSTTTGPWKLEYKGSYSSNENPYNITLDSYKSKYSIQSVPIFELKQWDGNSFQHAAYGVVCAYSNAGNVDHTAFFEANNHYGCYLTGATHSSSLSLTFDEYMSSGLPSLIPQP